MICENHKTTCVNISKQLGKFSVDFEGNHMFVANMRLFPWTWRMVH